MITAIGWFLVGVCALILILVALAPLLIPDRCDCRECQGLPLALWSMHMDECDGFHCDGCGPTRREGGDGA